MTGGMADDPVDTEVDPEDDENITDPNGEPDEDDPLALEWGDDYEYDLNRAREDEAR